MNLLAVYPIFQRQPREIPDLCGSLSSLLCRSAAQELGTQPSPPTPTASSSVPQIDDQDFDHASSAMMFPFVTRISSSRPFRVLAGCINADQLRLSVFLGVRRSQSGQIELRSIVNACDQSMSMRDKRFSLPDS